MKRVTLLQSVLDSLKKQILENDNIYKISVQMLLIKGEFW